MKMHTGRIMKRHWRKSAEAGKPATGCGTFLGHSPTAQYYSIENLAEAEAFLAHPVLGAHLVEISRALLALETNNADLVFGYPDNLKLRSSMTLFAQVREADPVFGQVLDKFFEGKPDQRTLALLKE